MLRQRAQTSAKSSNLNRKWCGRDSNPDFQINPDWNPDVCPLCRIAPKMLWVHYLVDASHFVEWCWKWKSNLEFVSGTGSSRKVNQFFQVAGAILTSISLNEIGWLHNLQTLSRTQQTERHTERITNKPIWSHDLALAEVKFTLSFFEKLQFLSCYVFSRLMVTFLRETFATHVKLQRAIASMILRKTSSAHPCLTSIISYICINFSVKNETICRLFCWQILSTASRNCVCSTRGRLTPGNRSLMMPWNSGTSCARNLGRLTSTIDRSICSHNRTVILNTAAGLGKVLTAYPKNIGQAPKWYWHTYHVITRLC